MSSIASRLTFARVSLAVLVGSSAVVAGSVVVNAQMMNTGPRMNVNVAPRMPNINITPTNPSIRYSPENRYRVQGANPDKPTTGRPQGDRPKNDRPPRRPPVLVVTTGNPGNPGGLVPPPPPPGPPPQAAKKKSAPVAVTNRNFVPNEVLIEVNGQPSDAQVDALARRHRLTRVESQTFELTGTTLFRWRIADRRSVDTVQRQLAADLNVVSTYKNFRFSLQQAQAAPAGDPAQYVVPKMKLTQAHQLSSGQGVVVAVIDSGIDVAHPELSGVVIGSFDALKSSEKPHSHGTGIAGAIAARSRLLGAAPNAHILAVRAFGVSAGGADSTSFNILKGLEYSVANKAQVINMSFAGPTDPLLERALANVASRNIVMVAAAGNAGPKSPPLFPASDKNVIAVSATDANDQIFTASNRGKHVAITAPGVDILVPAPEAKYQITSGTSFAAAYISGLVALMIDRKPDLTPVEIRGLLASTARDLGPRGRDDDYGAGLADAFGAVTAVSGSTAPVAVSAPSPVR